EAGSQLFLRRLKAVADGRKLGGGVAGKRRWPLHQASRAIAPGDAQDLVAIAAHGDRVEETAGASLVKRMRKERFSRHHPDVLRRDALRACPRANGAKPLHSRTH